MRSGLMRFVSFSILICALQGAAISAAQRPNIIVIMSDDMGWSDLGCYGSEINTPNLDSLAKNGLRFTQFYNTARCCPTRASILAGLYPHQAGIGHMMNDRGLDGYRGNLNNRCVTIAEVLRSAGYRTYAIGKWHVTLDDRRDGPKDNWPLQRGFDKYYGLIWGVSSQFDPAVCRGNTWYSCENDPDYKSDEFYFTNALSDNAVAFIKQHQKEAPEKPFFMYVAYTAAHWPMQALDRDIAKYKGKYDAGYDAIRKARLEKQRKLGLLDPRWQPSPIAGKWADVENREWELRCMEVYAAMIDCMDQGIGRIVAELKRQGRLDNTLILFLQDNGGCAEPMGRNKPTAPWPTNLQPLRPDELPASGHPKQTRDGRPVRFGPDVMPGGPDTYIGYGLAWANVSNTPFREYKHWVHEGGISTPLIVHWPERIARKRRNELVKDPGHLIDIMATCVDVARAKYPTEYNGRQIKPMQGVSLVPAITGGTLQRPQPIFWEHEGNRAVRDGRWKLVAKENQPWELYNMDADRAEMNDLASRHPKRVKAMAAQWDAYAARADVLPLGAWRGEKTDSREPVEKKKFFTLNQGDELARADSPVVADRGLTITAEITKMAPNGVILAQGAKTHGYALCLRDGHPCFFVRREADLMVLMAKETLADRPTTVAAVLLAGGGARIEIDGRTVAEDRKIRPVTRTPVDGLAVGRETGDPVGDYEPPFTFDGKLGTVTVEVAPAVR